MRSAAWAAADVPSPRQAEVLRFIRRCVAGRGYPPTNREILAELGATSTNWSADVLRALERKGFITRLRGQPRTLALTRAGHRYLGGGL